MQVNNLLLLGAGLLGGYLLFSKKGTASSGADIPVAPEKTHGTLIEVKWADRAFETGYFSNETLKDEIMFLGGLALSSVSKDGNTEVYDAGKIDKLALDAITTALKIIPGAVVSVKVLS